MRVGTLPRGGPLAPCSCLGHFCGLQGTWVYHAAQENTLPGISLCQPLGVAGLGRSPARISSAPSTPTCPLAQQERAHSLWGSEEQKRTLCPPRAASGDACSSLACGLHLLSCSFFSLDWHLLWVSAWHGDRYLAPGHHPAPHPQACALVAGQMESSAMSPADSCSCSPTAPLPSTLHSLVGSSRVGALETLSHGSVCQLLMPEGPTNDRRLSLGLSLISGPCVGQWLLMVWAAFKPGLFVRWHETCCAWAWPELQCLLPSDVWAGHAGHWFVSTQLQPIPFQYFNYGIKDI